MIKRFNKLLLIFGVFLFGIVGCSNSNDSGSNGINATYIKMSSQEDIIDGSFTIVNKYPDLFRLLGYDAPKKYNVDFFETKSLLVFEIVESNSGNKSVIDDYIINEETLNLYIKTKQYGDTTDMGYWWFILELTKDEIEMFDSVKIYKNGEEIKNDIVLKIDLLTDEVSDYIKQTFANKINELRAEPLTIDAIVIKNYIGEFNGVYVAIIRGDAPVIQQANMKYICRIKNKLYPFLSPRIY